MTMVSSLRRTALSADRTLLVPVRVHAGYHPRTIQVGQDVPVDLVFDRRETGHCTSEVVFPDLQVATELPPFERTTVRFEPDRPGTYRFICGMNVIEGALVVVSGMDATSRRSGLMLIENRIIGGRRYAVLYDTNGHIAAMARDSDRAWLHDVARAF
ncbi:MAG TPA: cupredoxin domain-containing protein [Jiangellaceae bacterium]